MKFDLIFLLSWSFKSEIKSKGKGKILPVLN